MSNCTYYLPCLFLLVLTSCRSSTEEANPYLSALDAARHQPTYPVVGAGLRLGMAPAQVTHRLDSLRAGDALTWQLSSGRLCMQAEPDYVNGCLVRLRLQVAGSGETNSLDYLELRRGLEQAYGTGYAHGLPTEEDAVQSWFKGGTEIELLTQPGLGYALTYTDLHQQHALTLAHLADDSLQLEQMSQEPRTGHSR